ncbi:MAG: 6-phosphofructokinase [Ruminococcaceae bacterium]|nr:6-phosphofructokinase [Oscillospiraceae bacterium]
MQKFRKIGVLTSGGDAPGMNAAIRAVTLAAEVNGVDVVAIYDGYQGLMEGNVHDISAKDVSGVIRIGGTFLHSARSPEFMLEEGMQRAIATCKKHGIDGIVAIGGDGTFRGATDLTLRGIPCIGIPGTIDNDVTASDSTIGYDTALKTTVTMIDCLRDTCESHARCNVVEVMGRHAGYIALESAIATGAEAVIIKEIPHDEDAIIKRIADLKANGKRSFIIVVSEGLGNYGETLAPKIEAFTGVETRFARFAHVVRGGVPTVADRVMATQMGAKAVELLLAGKSNLVVCKRNGKIVSEEIRYALTVDRMFKGKLKDGDLDTFSEEQIESMKALCELRTKEIRRLYDLVDKVAK